MNKTQIIALITFILSHTLLILYMVLDNELGNYTYLFYTAWGLGIISVISNIILADQIKTKRWLILIFGLSGIFWFFPPLLITFLGFPFLIIFFFIAVYVQTKAIMIKD